MLTLNRNFFYNNYSFISVLLVEAEIIEFQFQQFYNRYLPRIRAHIYFTKVFKILNIFFENLKSSCWKEFRFREQNFWLKIKGFVKSQNIFLKVKSFGKSQFFCLKISRKAQMSVYKPKRSLKVNYLSKNKSFIKIPNFCL